MSVTSEERIARLEGRIQFLETVVATALKVSIKFDDRESLEVFHNTFVKIKERFDSTQNQHQKGIAQAANTLASAMQTHIDNLIESDIKGTPPKGVPDNQPKNYGYAS